MKPTVQLLIIEDNESDIDILKRLLRRSGLDMEPAVADELPEILGLLDTRPGDLSRLLDRIAELARRSVEDTQGCLRIVF